MKRLTTDKYPWALRTEYYKSAYRRYMRFGQWVWNTYGISGETWPELFYASETQALALLCERHAAMLGEEG